MGYLEIIFENRNKLYGAYELRKNYNYRLLKSLIITILSTMLFIILISSKDKEKINKNVSYAVNDINLKQINNIKEEVKEVKRVKEIKIKSVKYTVPVIRKDIEVKSQDTIPDQKVIDESKIDKKTEDGDKNDGKTITKNESVEVDEKTTTKDDDNVIFEKVEKEAEFPGGFDKWKEYLQRKLDSNIPVENGAPSGLYRVEIQFIVDNSGNISNVDPMTNYGYGMEQEASKIIKNGPNWIPAIQNGIKVKSYKRQIIIFQIVSE